MKGSHVNIWKIKKILVHSYLFLHKILIHILSSYNLNIKKKEQMMLVGGLGQIEQEDSHLERDGAGQISRMSEQYVPIYIDSQICKE